MIRVDRPFTFTNPQFSINNFTVEDWKEVDGQLTDEVYLSIQAPGEFWEEGVSRKEFIEFLKLLKYHFLDGLEVTDQDANEANDAAARI